MKIPLLALSTVVVAGLGCEVHDNTINIPNATLNVEASADVDVNNVEPSQSVPMMVVVHNVTLVEPSATPPPEHVADAGHLEFHLDDEATPPLLVTAQTNVVVKIPAETKPGKHKIICRVHKHDGTPTDTKVEVAINVTASVSVGHDDAGQTTVDASASAEVGVVVTTGSEADAGADSSSTTVVGM
jgi:hypothetical protein